MVRHWSDNGLCFVVVEAGIGADDGAADLMLEYVGVAVVWCALCVQRNLKGKDDGHAEFVLVGAEGTFVVAEFLGQHGDDAVHEIDGSTAAVRLFVHLGVRADVK